MDVCRHLLNSWSVSASGGTRRAEPRARGFDVHCDGNRSARYASRHRSAGSRKTEQPYEDAVGIVDCQRVSQDLSVLLDVEEDNLETAALGQAYTLEVSSPGLDRPLRHEGDYRRFQGRLAKVVTTEPVNGQSAFSGRLAGIDHGVVLLEEGRRVHRVPLAHIKRARLEVEF